MEKQETPATSSHGPVIAAMMLGLLLTYPLSVGPAVWLVNHGSRGLEPYLEVVYAPIEMAYRNFGPVRALLDFYLGLFR